MDVGGPAGGFVVLKDHLGGAVRVIERIAAAIVKVVPGELGRGGFVGDGGRFAVAVNIRHLDAVDARAAIDLIGVELVIDEVFVEEDLEGIDLGIAAPFDADDDGGFAFVFGRAKADGGLAGPDGVGHDVPRAVPHFEVIVAIAKGIVGDALVRVVFV